MAVVERSDLGWAGGTFAFNDSLSLSRDNVEKFLGGVIEIDHWIKRCGPDSGRPQNDKRTLADFLLARLRG